MIASWTHKRAESSDSAEAAVRQVGWEEAQLWCNFVLMRPTVLPEGTTIEKAGVRPEAPPGRHGDNDGSHPTWTESNRSGFRFEIVGAGRRLRVKEFLYDWAPPAFDHPCLWLSGTSGFKIGDDIGWLGLDYRKLPGASLTLDRTSIELAVLEGNFTAEEIQALYRSFEPVDPGAREQILCTPLADLSYQSRHREPAIAVPVGYWAHKRKPPAVASYVFRAEDAPRGLPGESIVPPASYGYHLDSVFVYGELEQPQEADFAYERDGRPGHYLRVLASPSTAADGVRYPPVLDRQPCLSEVLNIGGREVYYAFHETEKVGPHEAVWQEDGLNVMLLFKPSPDTNRAWFLNLLEQMISGQSAQRGI